MQNHINTLWKTTLKYCAKKHEHIVQNHINTLWKTTLIHYVVKRIEDIRFFHSEAENIMVYSANKQAEYVRLDTNYNVQRELIQDTTRINPRHNAN